MRLINRTIEDLKPSQNPYEVRDDAAAYPAYERLVNTVSACQTAAVVRCDRPTDTLAHIIWSTLHGLISLEFVGYVQPAVALERFESATEFLLTALREQDGQPEGK